MAGPLIDIKIDKAQLRNVQRMLKDIPGALPSVISRGINHTLTPIKTSIARQLIGPVNTELKAVAAAQKKTRRMVPRKLKKGSAGKLGIRQKGNYAFKIATIKRNIRFQKATKKIWKGMLWIKRFKGQEAKKSKKTMFVAEMKSGHISLFRRLGEARLPIANQLRRLMVQFFTGISNKLKKETEVRLKRNIEFYIKQVLDKWRKGARKAG
jgi:hypothetical protein